MMYDEIIDANDATYVALCVLGGLLRLVRMETARC